MRILYLDDSPDRIADAFTRYAEHEMIAVATAKGAIEQIKMHRTLENTTRPEGMAFDLISLDHDLGGETFVDSAREDCGMEVVRFLEQTRYTVHNIIIHSWNPDAAKAMYVALKKAGYKVGRKPFGMGQHSEGVE